MAAEVGLGWLADRQWGDPRRLHPVAGFGGLALDLEAAMWRPTRRCGAAFWLILLTPIVLLWQAIERRIADDGVAARLLGAATIWVTLGGRSLELEALRLARLVEDGHLEEARAMAPALVGRDPTRLDGGDLIRAGVESVAENTSDAVVAPLLWAAICGPAGALAYRAANTLDAMFGKPDGRNRRFGWASARFDDLLNWPAARLTVLLTALCSPLVGGSPPRALLAARRQGHPSPNAPLVEGAFAGALDLRLGGPVVYAHGAEDRPELGSGRRPAPEDLRTASRLSIAVGFAAAGLLTCLSRR